MTTYRTGYFKAKECAECSDCGALITPAGQVNHTRVHGEIQVLRRELEALKRSLP